MAQRPTTLGIPRGITLSLALGIAAAVALSGCTGSGGSPTATPTASDSSASGTGSASGILPGYRSETVTRFSPLIVTAVAQDPVPVPSSDGKTYLAYEISVFNASPRDATITSIETLSGSESGPVIATMDQARVAASTMLLGTYSPSQTGSAQILAGQTKLVIVRVGYQPGDAIPTAFTHRVSATFESAAAGQMQFASIFPDSAVAYGGAVTVSGDEPIVIGPPVIGDDWMANNGLSETELNPHSLAMLPVGGRINGTERYAIDFIRAIDTASGPEAYSGDPSDNSSYFAYDQPLVAVKDATVVSVVSDRPEEDPQFLHDFMGPIDGYPGNYIVLDLGDDIFAVYAHVKRGTASVAVGDRVQRGQEIGRVGNSGNTSDAHLHFQLQRGAIPLTADNVAWVIDSFTATGVYSPTGIKPTPTDGKRVNEFPAADTISSFPVPRS